MLRKHVFPPGKSMELNPLYVIYRTDTPCSDGDNACLLFDVDKWA